MKELHVTTRGRGAGDVAEVETSDAVPWCDGCALSYGDEATAERVRAGICRAQPCGARMIDRRTLARRQRRQRAERDRDAALCGLVAAIGAGDVSTAEVRRVLRELERCDAAILANRDPTPAEHAEAEFHRSRRAFFLPGDGPLLIPAGDPRSHREFATTQTTRGDLMAWPRGYAQGGRLVVYQREGGAHRPDWFADTPEAERAVRRWLRSLAGLLNLDGATSVELGSVPSEPGGAWPSRRVLGRLDDLLAAEATP